MFPIVEISRGDVLYDSYLYGSYWSVNELRCVERALTFQIVLS